MQAEALRMEAGRFVEAVQGSRELRGLMDAYADALATSSDLMVTCFAFHPLAARFSTTLLNAHDASSGENVVATQELLASPCSAPASPVSPPPWSARA